MPKHRSLKMIRIRCAHCISKNQCDINMTPREHQTVASYRHFILRHTPKHEETMDEDHTRNLDQLAPIKSSGEEMNMHFALMKLNVASLQFQFLPNLLDQGPALALKHIFSRSLISICPTGRVQF